MIEYEIGIAQARVTEHGKFQQKAAAVLKEVLDRAKANGFQDPPIETEVAEEHIRLGPIRRGIETSLDLAVKNGSFEHTTYACGIRSALDVAEKFGFVDTDSSGDSFN